MEAHASKSEVEPDIGQLEHLFVHEIQKEGITSEAIVLFRLWTQKQVTDIKTETLQGEEAVNKLKRKRNKLFNLAGIPNGKKS